MQFQCLRIKLKKLRKLSAIDLAAKLIKQDGRCLEILKYLLFLKLSKRNIKSIKSPRRLEILKS